MARKVYQPPSTVAGTTVEVMGEPLDFQGERWVTLVPPGDDDRLWEWSLTTGRLIQTRKA
jgi:hypothetical protein